MQSHDSVPEVAPCIHLSAAECDTLSELALSARRRHPQSSAMLLAELERAVICDVGDLPPDTISMNSTIDFVDEGSGARHVVQLVYPADADIGAGRISILTPIGAGLIGMTAGQAIRWPDREGHDRLLRIISVSRPDGE